MTPHIEQQTIGVSFPGSATGIALPGAHLRLTTVALNVLTRDTSFGDFQAYGGVGPGLFIASSSANAVSQAHTSFGLNLLAGGRYFVSRHVALFGEFKYVRTTLQAAGLRADYSGQVFIGGISWHFSQPAAMNTANGPQ